MFYHKTGCSRQTVYFKGGVFVISAAILGLELVLMRCLSLSSYHHFFYLVLTIALLGFGASGTFIFLFQKFLLTRFERIIPFLAALFTLSIILSFQLAHSLPLDIQFILFDKRQVFLLFLYHFLIFIPFFIGALIIALSINKNLTIVHSLYAVNLNGSGFGIFFTTLLMFYIPSVNLFYVIAGLGWIGSLLFACSVSIHNKGKITKESPSRSFYPFVYPLLTLVILSFSGIIFPLRLRIDPYKMLSQVKTLETQKKATHLISKISPRAQLDVYDSPQIHLTLFASLMADSPPPPQMLLLYDGALLAPVFKIRRAADAAVMKFTPAEISYRLSHPKSVLLLGETGGSHVWLARLHNARKITVVQPNRQIFDIFQKDLLHPSGGVFTGHDLACISMDPRTFLEQTRECFDLIHIVSLETPAAGVSGLQSLNENYLLTREGIASALSCLNPGGILSVTRGLQSPPRDNVKILATFIEALESKQIPLPQKHIIQVRNYLAASTLVSSLPFHESQLKELRSISQELMLDIEWAPDIRMDELNRFDKRQGPPGSSFSYYHYAALNLFGDKQQRKTFYRKWAYNVIPATDDKPYFFDFFKWRSIYKLMKAYGNHWLQRLELGYVVLIVALMESLLVAIPFILLPLPWRKRFIGKDKRPVISLVYFALLGIAYITIEMVFIQKFIFFLGDPIYSVSVVMTAFLIFSGWGSATIGSHSSSPDKMIRKSIRFILLLGLCYLLGLRPLFKLLAGMSFVLRLLISLILLFPLSFFMGKPFPLGLSLLKGKGEHDVSLAWGINGFCSVLAASGTMILSMSLGFSLVLIISLCFYACAAFLVRHKSCSSIDMKGDESHETR